MLTIKEFSHTTKQSGHSAFTIVELLIVIVVIGILATLVFITYTGVNQKAAASVLQADLANTKTQLGIARVNSTDETYPNDIDSYKHSDGVTLEYTSDGSSYCVTASSPEAGTAYNLDSTTGQITEGACEGHTGAGGEEGIADGDFIQTITSANCPDDRTRAVDARDNHTYWVQKLADGKCWMLTNLAYAGGGTDTYGDVKSLTEGASDPNTFTEPRYYIPPDANPTTEPNEPTVTFNSDPETPPLYGVNASPQYGYLYNWCGAMGGQATAACASATTPTPDPDISICPAGWRLPTGEPTTGETTLLNSAINGGSSTSTAEFFEAFLIQFSGAWFNENNFFMQNVYSIYWPSSQYSDTRAYSLYISSGVISAYNNNKSEAYSVRCIAV